MATSYGTDPRDLLRGGSQGAANQQMLDAARAAQRTSPAAPSGVTTQPAANGVADAARQLTGSRVVPPQTPMQNMAESLRAGTPTGPTAPTGPAAPTGPTNPSFAGGNPSPQAQAWQASRAAAPTASSAPPVGSAPAAPAPAAAAQAAPKAGGLRGAWEATKAFPGRVTSGVGSVLSTGVGIARAGVGPALALTPSRLANGELTPEILSAFDDAKKNGYMGTKTLSDVAVMPNGSQARENIYGRGNPELSTQPGGTGLPQGTSTSSTSAPAPAPSASNVTRVGNSYSGPAGIKAEGMTINGKAPGGSFNVVPAGSFGGVSPSMDAQLNQARMAAANRGDFDAVARSYGGNFAGGSGGQSGLRGGYTPQRVEGRMGYTQQEARDLLKQAMTKQPGESRADFATRSGAALKALGLEVDERGSIRTNDTSRANNEATNSTTRRGQDMDMSAKMADRQAKLAERQLRANIWQASGGDPRKAAEMMYASGLDGKDMFGLAKDAQTYGSNARKNAETSLERFMTTDKDGKITEKGRADIRSAVEKLAPGYFNMSEDERLADQPKVEAGLQVLMGMNATKDNSWLQAIGIDGENPAQTTLPDMKGGQLEEAGFLDWIGPKVSRNDYKLRLPGGQVQYLPRGSVNQDVFDLLNEQGVDTSKLRQ